MWCVPTLDGEYKKRMFDVLDLYEQDYDPLLPVVCLDEKIVELHDERRPPIRSRSGVRRDHEYIRKGTANLFVVTEPKGGRHYVQIAIGIMQQCCLGRDRIGDLETLRQRVIPFWQKRRDQRWTIDWRFTKKKAKIWIKTFESQH